MYALDNDSGVQTMPEVKAKKFNHNEPRWFTEGGNGVAPSYPGADWFNIVQAELLGVLTAGGIEPSKTNLNQLTQAIQQVVQNKVNTAVNGKADTRHRHAMSDVSGLSDALGAKAPLTSPALTGTPTAPTASQETNNTQIATTAFVKAAIARKADTSHSHTYSQITDFEQGVLRYINQGFTQSLSETGWTKLPNGLIEQWGKVTLNPGYYGGETDTSVTFPIAFPSTVLNVQVSYAVMTDKRITQDTVLSALSTTGVTIRQQSDRNVIVYWRAIGR